MRRRWVKVSVAVAVVLCLGGWFAHPYVQDWRLARQACDGALPAEAVQRLMPEGAHLAHVDSQASGGVHTYLCRLTMEGADGDDGERQYLKTTAYMLQSDQEREFEDVFPSTGFAPISPLPEGMPGFVDAHGIVRLLLPCPGLGPDPSGRPSTLLVSTDLGYYATLSAQPVAAYAVAVAFANHASKQLGCGAARLTVPEGVRKPASLLPPDEPATVPLPRVTGAACGWLAGAELPQGAEWRVAVRTNDAAPVTRCNLSTGGHGNGEQHELVFAGWYGDWSDRLTDWHVMPGSLTAEARCRNEAAHYTLRVSGSPGIDADVNQRLFETFVHHEADRHGCTDPHVTR